jgi:xylulokinase
METAPRPRESAGGPPTGDLFLGIDLGTSSVKALIADASGSVLATGSVPVATAFGPGGSAEQDLDETWSALVAAVRQAVGAADTAASRVAAIGISSQAGALQLLDHDECPVGPVIGWQDARGAPWDEAVMARLGRDWFARHAGTPRSFLSVGQVLRLREQGAIGADRRIGWLGDCIVRRLCGVRAHDATTVSEAGLYNPAEGCVDQQMLELLGMDPAHLPALLPAASAAGALLPDAASALGLPQRIPVTPAVHDQYTAALGCGVVRPGDAMVGAGTAWVLLALEDSLRAPASPVSIAGRTLVDGVFGQLTTMVNGGSCIRWALSLLNFGDRSVRDIDELVGRVPPGSDGLRFRPLLSPLGAAGLPASLPGRLDGLRLTHGAAHVLRALVEGLACELARHAALVTAAGVPPRRLVMSGKGAASSVTPVIVADTLGMPVERSRVTEASVFGAAILARATVEPDKSLPALVDEMVPRPVRVEPGPGTGAARSRFTDYVRSLGADGRVGGADPAGAAP